MLCELVLEHLKLTDIQNLEHLKLQIFKTVNVP